MQNTKKQLNAWFTITDYVDLETGEVINPKGIQNGHWTKVKLIKHKNKHSGNNYSRQQTWLCRRTGQQLRLFEQYEANR